MFPFTTNLPVESGPVIGGAEEPPNAPVKAWRLDAEPAAAEDVAWAEDVTADDTVAFPVVVAATDELTALAVVVTAAEEAMEDLVALIEVLAAADEMTEEIPVLTEVEAAVVAEEMTEEPVALIDVVVAAEETEDAVSFPVEVPTTEDKVDDEAARLVDAVTAVVCQGTDERSPRTFSRERTVPTFPPAAAPLADTVN